MRNTVFAILALLLALTGTAAAQSASNGQTEPPLDQWAKTLENVHAHMLEPKDDSPSLPQLRATLEDIQGEITTWIEKLEPEVKAATRELETLGEPPAEGQPPETTDVANKRKELQRKVEAVAGQTKLARLNLENAEQLLRQLAEMRRSLFAERLLERGPSPLSREIWSEALPEITSTTRTTNKVLRRIFGTSELSKHLEGSTAILIGAALAALILVFVLRLWLLQQYGRQPAIEFPSPLQIIRATFTVAIARAGLPTLAALFVYLVILQRDLLIESGQEIVRAILLGFVVFIWTVALFRAALSPTLPSWRIIQIPSRFASGAQRLIAGLALVYAIDLVVAAFIDVYSAPLATTIMRDYLLTVTVTVLLVVLLLRQQMWAPEKPMDAQPRWRTARLLLALGLIVMLVIGSIGYVSLARYVVTQLALSGGLIFLLIVLRRLFHELITQLVSETTWPGARLRAALQMDDASAGRLRFWATFFLDFILLLVALVVGLVIWGANQRDLAVWTNKIFFELKVGGVPLSLSVVATAVAVIVGLVVLTRLLQRALANTVLPQTRLDPSLQQSIHTGLGYLGIVIAAIAGLSTLGLDLSNLAIIAGALSVGIGFGLQNMVNNFVSGLIVLFERPVKVGDWIIVGNIQGYVRQIKVRATEIETFDRSSVFIPNSELISQPVTNWTYADQVGRIIIPVGVAYGSDTEKVRMVLEQVAQANLAILTVPPPQGLFRGFGDSALNFELRCYLTDISKVIQVTSELCFAIDKAFREEGISIPFPQRDIHLISGNPKNGGLAG